jgi:membrane-associated phospholipid phosphatase
MRTRPTSYLASLVAATLIVGTATGAHAQSLSSESRSGDVPVKSLLTNTIDGFGHLKSPDSLGILAIGGAAAAAVHPADNEITEDFAHPGALRKTFKSGTYLGGTPLQLGAAFAVYGVGRALHHPCAAALGADLVSAGLMAQGLTLGLKALSQRERPDGSSGSFPSGHAAMSFASATVLQKHYGWKVGIPAYAVASYVAASRVQTDRHYASDVIFGAAIGLVSGRSITFGSQRFLFEPSASQHGAGLALSWAGPKNP